MDFLKLNLSCLPYCWLFVLATVFFTFNISTLFQISWSGFFPHLFKYIYIVLSNNTASDDKYFILSLKIIFLEGLVFWLQSSGSLVDNSYFPIMIIEGGIKIRLWFVPVPWNLRKAIEVNPRRVPVTSDSKFAVNSRQLCFFFFFF